MLHCLSSGRSRRGAIWPPPLFSWRFMASTVCALRSRDLMSMSPRTLMCMHEYNTGWMCRVLLGFLRPTNFLVICITRYPSTQPLSCSQCPLIYHFLLYSTFTVHRVRYTCRLGHILSFLYKQCMACSHRVGGVFVSLMATVQIHYVSTTACVRVCSINSLRELSDVNTCTYMYITHTVVIWS